MSADAPGDPAGEISPPPGGPPADALVYPLGLRVRGRLAVVIGRGAAAERRVASLVRAGADVLVVAPELSPSLEGLAAGGRITVRRGDYAACDLDGAWLVIACAGDPRADAAVAADAERRRIWCASDSDSAGSLAWMPDEQRAAGKPGATAGPGAGTEPAEGSRGSAAPGAATDAGEGSRGSAAPGAATDAGELRSGYCGHRVLVLGGARSGKSVTAERLLAEHAHVDYIATGPVPGPGDAEWAARVLIHRQRRPAGWRTVETLDVERELAGAGAAHTGPATAEALAGATAPVLVDCLSTWLAGVMDECGMWTGQQGADQVLAHRTETLAEAWRTTRRHVVAVSSEVGSGVVPGTVSGRRFRDELGSLNARFAAECDEVWLCTAGIARRLR